MTAALVDIDARPPVGAGEIVELELVRSLTQLLRVTSGHYGSRRVLSLETWIRRRDRPTSWWCPRRVRLSPNEAADVARSIVEASRRAKR